MTAETAETAAAISADITRREAELAELHDKLRSAGEERTAAVGRADDKAADKADAAVARIERTVATRAEILEGRRAHRSEAERRELRDRVRAEIADLRKAHHEPRVAVVERARNHLEALREAIAELTKQDDGARLLGFRAEAVGLRIGVLPDPEREQRQGEETWRINWPNPEGGVFQGGLGEALKAGVVRLGDEGPEAVAEGVTIESQGRDMPMRLAEINLPKWRAA